MAYVLKYDRVRCCDCSAPTVITPKGRKGKRCAPCMRKLRGPKTQRRKCGEGWVDRSCLHCRREFRRLERGPSDRARYCSAACAAKRDGWKCRMCGCDTPRSLRGTTLANAPECDHVIPLSRGGSSTASNMQCLCRRCNALKGSKLPCELSQRQPAGDAIDHPLGGRIVEAGGAYASP